MDSIKYLKLDLRVIKGKIKISLVLPIFIGMMIIFINNTAIVGIGYLFFLLIGLATMPFDSSISEKSTEMYYMFPAKTSSMVFGRFLYLICSTFGIFILNGVIMTYLYKINELNNLQVLLNCLCGLSSVVACCIQYPIYYKFGLEKGRILSMIIYLVPAFIVFMLPDILKEMTIIKNINDGSKLNLIFLIVSLLITIFIGYLSYLTSVTICKSKEI